MCSLALCGACGGRKEFQVRSFRASFRESCLWLGTFEFAIVVNFSLVYSVITWCPPWFQTSSWSETSVCVSNEMLFGGRSTISERSVSHHVLPVFHGRSRSSLPIIQKLISCASHRRASTFGLKLRLRRRLRFRFRLPTDVKCQVSSVKSQPRCHVHLVQGSSQTLSSRPLRSGPEYACALQVITSSSGRLQIPACDTRLALCECAARGLDVDRSHSCSPHHGDRHSTAMRDRLLSRNALYGSRPLTTNVQWEAKAL